MGDITSLADIMRVHGVDRAEHTALVQDDRRRTTTEDEVTDLDTWFVG